MKRYLIEHEKQHARLMKRLKGRSLEGMSAPQIYAKLLETKPTGE